MQQLTSNQLERIIAIIDRISLLGHVRDLPGQYPDIDFLKALRESAAAIEVSSVYPVDPTANQTLEQLWQRHYRVKTLTNLGRILEERAIDIDKTLALTKHLWMTRAKAAMVDKTPDGMDDLLVMLQHSQNIPGCYINPLIAVQSMPHDQIQYPFFQGAGDQSAWSQVCQMTDRLVIPDECSDLLNRTKDTQYVKELVFALNETMGTAIEQTDDQQSARQNYQQFKRDRTQQFVRYVANQRFVDQDYLKDLIYQFWRVRFHLYHEPKSQMTTRLIGHAASRSGQLSPEHQVVFDRVFAAY